MKQRLIISEEVHDALNSRKAVVALESTIISHGMPYPQNIETALEVEHLVRSQQAIPATIAVIDGSIHIGLSQKQLEFVGSPTNSQAFHKLSTADLPFALSKNFCGSTTVAATLFCAERAGIKVMATGGLGGAHRDCQDTMDISADLGEMRRMSQTVVCSGVKSILDIGKTLELLETFQIPIIGYQSYEMPAFYSSSSGHKLNWRVESAQEIAELMLAKEEIGVKGSTIIAAAPPLEYALDFQKMENIIEQGLAAAKSQGISGKAVTPFLLAAVEKLTSGASLRVNKALIKNNATIAAQIATCFHAQI